MKFISFFYILFLIALTSCTSDDISIEIQNKVNLQFLEIGQETKFLRYNSTCENITSNLEFSGDTLVWKVISKSENTYKSKEYFTSGSPNFANLDTVNLDIIFKRDYVLIPNRIISNLFFFYGNDTIFTNPIPTIDLSQLDCSFIDNENVVFTGDAIANVNQANFGDTLLENQTLVSCVPIFFDMNAYILYKNGEISSIHFNESGFGGIFATGWQVLEE